MSGFGELQLVPYADWLASYDIDPVTDPGTCAALLIDGMGVAPGAAIEIVAVLALRQEHRRTA